MCVAGNLGDHLIGNTYIQFYDEDDAQKARHIYSHYHDLGLIFQAPSTDSNEPLCMLNHQRGLTLPRPTAAHTATSSAHV